MSLLERILDFFYPPKCVLCGKMLRSEQTDLCSSCRMEMPRCEYPFKRGANYQECFSVSYYEGNSAKSICRFKFRGKAYYAEAYGRLMAMLILQKQIDFDLLTWVPISKERQRKRGYTQTKLIAEAIGRELGIEPISLLQKIRHNDPQSSLRKYSDRAKNVEDVYCAINTERLKDKTVLLIDDVITSGATLSECSRTLKNSGAKSIVCMTFAVTRQ